MIAMSPNSLPSDPTATDLLLALVRLEAKVDTFVSSSTDHEARLRMLEKARWPLPSLAVVLALASAGIAGAGLITR